MGFNSAFKGLRWAMLSQDYLTLMMKALQSFKTLETTHKYIHTYTHIHTHTHTQTQYHIPEDQILKRGNVSGDHCLKIEVLSIKMV
jgi:hypothetical protein